MIYAAVILAVFTALVVCVPLTALAEVHEIRTEPAQKCGPQCVIETAGFDTRAEADSFWAKYVSLNGVGGHPPYQATNSGLWFVDYQVTESESEAL